MATLSLETLRDRVRARAQVVVTEAGRHKSSRVNEYINEALEEYHLVLTECGQPQRVKRATASTSASSTATNGFPAYGYVALPTDFLSLFGVWVVNDDGSQDPLDAFTEHDYEYAGETGRPMRFMVAEDSNGLKILRLLPNADDAYTIAVTYLPKPTELALDTEPFEFFPGTAEFVVCDAAMRLLEDDGVQEGGHYQSVQARREQARKRLYDFAMRQNRAAPTVIDPPPRIGNTARLPDYLR